MHLEFFQGYSNNNNSNTINDNHNSNINAVDYDSDIDSSNDEKGNYFRIFSLFLLLYTWSLVLTFIPVFMDVGPHGIYGDHYDWYNGDDIIRIIEPIGGTIIHLYVFLESGIFSIPRTTTVTWCILLWAFGAALYGQGAGFHSASCMFKAVLESTPPAYQDDIYRDALYYVRTVWEHIISHYIYASGYAIMCCCYAYAYRNHSTVGCCIDTTSKMLFLAAAIVYGVLIAGVAADFPSGCIVALVYICFYGFGILGGYTFYLYRSDIDSKVFVFGRRPVLQFFISSYTIAFVLVIAWIIFAGGLKTRSQVGI